MDFQTHLTIHQNQYDVEVTEFASGNGLIEVVHMTNRGLQYLGETGTLSGSPSTTLSNNFWPGLGLNRLVMIVS